MLPILAIVLNGLVFLGFGCGGTFDDPPSAVDLRRAMLLIDVSAEDVARCGGDDADIVALRASVASHSAAISAVATARQQYVDAKRQAMKKADGSTQNSTSNEDQIGTLEAAWKNSASAARTLALADCRPELAARLAIVAGNKSRAIPDDYRGIDAPTSDMAALEAAVAARKAVGGDISKISVDDAARIAWAEARPEVAIARGNYAERLSRIRSALMN